MANPTKILTLGFKINIDEAGKAKLDNLTKGIEKGLDKAAAKTQTLSTLEAERILLAGQLEVLNKTLLASLEKQNVAIAKNNNFQRYAESSLNKAVEKHNTIAATIQKEVEATIQLTNATRTYDSLVGDIQSKTRDDVGTAARQLKLLEERKAREQETIAFLSGMETRKTNEAASLAKFHIEANANLDRVTTTNVINEKVALYNSLYDKIDARAKVARTTEALRPSGTFNYATGATIAKTSIASSSGPIVNSAPIVTNTDALTKNKVAADAAAKTHTNLFLRVGEAIGAYRVWNTTLMYSKEALMAIPKAGIELQSTKAALFGIFGSEQGAKNMQFLSELADNAGQSLVGLEQAYSRYAPSAKLAGAEQEAINKSFKDFAEVGTILHMPEEKLNSLFLALDQMFAKGKVQSEEIKKQLGNVLPGAVEVGAKAMEKSPAAFMDAMSKNLINAKEFIPKFAELYRKTFGGVDDSVFESVRDKLLSNLRRVENEYTKINRAIYAEIESSLNSVVKSTAGALTSIRENLTGIGQALEIFAGLIAGRVVVSIISLATNLTLLASTLKRVGSAIGAFTALSNPIVLAITAITAVGVGLYASLNNLSIGYDKASGFVVKFKEDQVSLTGYIEAAAIISVNKLKSAFEGLFNLEISNGSESYLATKLEELKHPIDSAVHAVFTLISAFEALKVGGAGKFAMIEAYNKSMTELQNNTSNVNEEIIKLAKTREEADKKSKEEAVIPPSSLPPTKEDGQLLNAAATAKALKDSYKDTIRASKLANQETETLLDELASKYADNLVSIKDYYAERVSLQLQNIENEKTFQKEIIRQASAGGDAASVEKARDQIELLNEKAKQFQPIADKERINDLRTYNATLANTTASYLEMTGATLAAAKARLEIQNAPLKQQLQTQISDVGSTQPEKDKAALVLGQVTAGEEITKINAAFEAAQRYRDKVNEISLAYTQMGASSSDVLTSSLGGYAALFNLFDNFQLRQQEMQLKMQDLIAEGDRLAQIKAVIPVGDNEAAIANQKEIETNAKQTQILDKQIAVNKLKTVGEALFTIESLTKKGTVANKVAHLAAIAASIAEKVQLLSLLVVKGASAVLTQGEGDPYSAFGRMAAMAALVAGIIAEVGGAFSGGGGETGPVTNTSTPVTDPAGSVFGDSAAISTSLEDTLSFLIDINYKAYTELVKLNFYTNKTSASIVDLNKLIAGGKLMDPSIAKTGTSSTGNKGALIGLAFGVVGALIGAIFDKTVVTTKIDEGLQTLHTSLKSIMTGAKAQVNQYTTLEETTSNLFTSSTKVYDVLQKATTQAVTIFTTIFKNIGNTLLNMANNVGETALVALYKYKFSSLKISLMGKTGDELTKQLTGVINKELDRAAMAVFGSMYRGLRDLKEGMFATVSRLVIQKEVVKGYFKDLGASFTVNSEEGVKFADTLLKVSSNAATGAARLQEFAKQQEDFFNNFATTLMKNNKTVANFAQGLSAVFNQGLSIDQITKTKAFVDYNKANSDLTTTLIKSSKLLKAEANLDKAKTPTQIRKAEKALLPLETAYNAQVTAAQDKLTKAKLGYDTSLNGSIASYQTLKDIFFNTVATTGDFGKALTDVWTGMDKTTESGIQAFVMLSNLSGEFKKLFDAIVQPIKNQIISIADSIDATSKEDLLKQLTASRDFESQKTISVKIQKLIVDKYNTEKTAINSIKNSFISLAATVKTLLGGDLSTKNPYEKLQLAQTEYTDLLAKSRSADLTVASDAASKLGVSAQAYLTQAKSYFGATAQYADIFNSVTTTLTDLSQTAESAADASTAQLEALGKAAIAELNNLATVTTTAIVATLEEGIEALKITDATKIATDQLSLLAGKADNLGISFDALIAKFNAEMGTPASKADSGIQSLVDKLAAARAAGDKGEMAKIDAQIKSYNKGFGKGGAELGAAYASNRLEYQNNLETIKQLTKDKTKAVGKADKDAIQIEITALQRKNKLLVGAFAGGGTVTTGMSLVGERGPELIRLPIGTNVINNRTTNRLLEDSNKQTINILSDMRKELIILNDRMGTIERKTRLTKPTLSMA